MKKILALIGIYALLAAGCSQSETIPLPEHPRPDFQRDAFVNLNGDWAFTFDADLARAAIGGDLSSLDRTISVPFPWGSELSGVKDEGDVAWYGRSVKVPSSWKGKRVFVVVGASDWETSAWFEGRELGTHKGGYTPFEFEITDLVAFGKPQTLMFKVDDTYADWHLYGKQGYGNARGIWQTVYLEARGGNFIRNVKFSPDIDRSLVKVDVALDSEEAGGSRIKVSFKNGEQEAFVSPVDGSGASFEIPISGQHLWDIEDPYLYEVSVSLVSDGRTVDSVSSYFGQRKISAVQVPGQDYAYIGLNNKPLYVQLCLDQSYHPDGFYTFPSDEFMKNEILISKNLGLNGNRIHIKAEVPRKLYWADKLGLLIMADVPNYWGEPVPEAREEWENCMRAQLERDFNHPSIFAWVDFNETWGLFSGEGEQRAYAPETQEWVRAMYKLTKELDPTRLVEDNSACNNDHVETDINSWHAYRTGYNWEATVSQYDNGTYPGSSFNYIGGNVQVGAPMINSECGNVWGYEGSAGDCDYTWDYHEMMNSFHRHPKVGGWLYTEHHDVINEWNGYVRFDRSEKIDGLCDIVPGMTVKDFHSPYYIVPMDEVCIDAVSGSTVGVQLMSSFVTDKDPGALTLKTQLVGYDSLGEEFSGSEASWPVEFKPFCLNPICNIGLVMPELNGIYALRMVLTNASGEVLHRNFSLYRVKGGKDAGDEVLTFAPAGFSACQWTKGSADVLGGLKVNGFGQGYFEYTLDSPADLSGLKSVQLVFEASAKQLFGKDVDDGVKVEGDFMLGKGTFDPCKNRNAYAMTDAKVFPSKVRVSVNGVDAGTYQLPDDPADHRGVLSWHSQPRDKYMSEAGSYGYLVKADVPLDAVKAGEPVVIRLSVPEDCDGGLAIYGKDFGRYPLDPSLVFTR